MSNFEWVSAQALGGKTVESVFYAERARHERELTGRRSALSAALEKAHSCKPDVFSYQALGAPGFDDILITADRSFAATKNAMACAVEARDAFRFTHGRVAMPQFPPALETALLCSGMVVVEAGVNASFFLNAHMSASPVSALLTSTLFSGTNVLVSTCAGYFIGRWLDWGKSTQEPSALEFRTRRMIARVCHGLSLLVIGALNLTLGLIRAQESLPDIEYSLARTVEVFTTPESFFLVLVGSCMSLLAWQKGKRGFDDPYPGYGDLQRKVDHETALLIEQMETYQDQITERIEEAKERAAKVLKAAGKQVSTFNEAVSACYRADHALREAVSLAQTRLRADISRIAAQYSGSKGQAVVFDEAMLSAMCDLSDGMTHSLPTYLSVPELQDFEREMARAQETALSQLATLFEAKNH